MTVTGKVAEVIVPGGKLIFQSSNFAGVEPEKRTEEKDYQDHAGDGALAGKVLVHPAVKEEDVNDGGVFVFAFGADDPMGCGPVEDSGDVVNIRETGPNSAEDGEEGTDAVPATAQRTDEDGDYGGAGSADGKVKSGL